MCQCSCGRERLLEARALLRRLAVPLRQQSRLPQHAVDAGRAHGHDVGVEHHERQPPVAFQRVLQMEVDDGLLLPILQPEVAGNPAVVLVGLAVAFPPVVELAGGDAEPADEPPDADLGLLRPAPDEIDDLVPRVVRNPDPGQSSPSFFLARHAPPSVRPGPRSWSGSSSPGRRSAPGRLSGSVRAFVLEGGRAVLEELLLPAVEHRGLQADARRRAPRPAPAPADAASGWRPSLPACSASVASSCVLSLS